MNLELPWPLLVALLVSGLGSAFLFRRARGHMCAECGHGQRAHRGGERICEALIGDWVPCGCERFTSALMTGSRISTTVKALTDIGDSASPAPAPEEKFVV